MEVKKVQDLDFKINTEDQQAIFNRFPKEYEMRMGVAYGTKYTEHLEGRPHFLMDGIHTIIEMMNRTMDIISKSVSMDTNVIERVHYIIDDSLKHILIYLELKNDEISRIVIPRFLGNKYSNIEAMRRISTNLSGQYNIKTRVYI